MKQVFYFKSYFTSFASILTYICMCGSEFRIRIRIQEAPEYGSNTDPDPQHLTVTNLGPCIFPQ